MSTFNQDDIHHPFSFVSLVQGCLLAVVAGFSTAHAAVPPPSTDVAMMSVGDGTTCAVLFDGRAKCWGRNDQGQLGLGHTETIGDDELPADVGFIDVGAPVQEIHTNGRQTFALLNDGVVRAWGANDSYQFGLGHTETIGDDETPAQANVLVDVPLGGEAVRLAVGDDFACALMEGGSVRCWGANDVGQLGYGHTRTIGDDESPAEAGDVVLGGVAVSAIAGAHHACALLSDGTMRCWGANDTGQLGYGHTETIGDDETPASKGPISVGGAVVEIAAGESHTCARLETGVVRCWGGNDAGQLGLGHTNTIGDDELPSSTSPIALGGTVAELAAGARHTCAIGTNAGLICWGEGLDGRLGYGNENDVGTLELPESAGTVDLADRIPTAVFIGPTGASTCVQLDDGAVRCWGLGDTGQLGQGDTASAADQPTTTPGRIPDIIVVDRDEG